MGAAAGVVAHRVTVTVEGDGNGVFRMHSGKAPRDFSSGAEALAYAEATARDLAERAALQVGAVAPKVMLNTRKFYLPDAMNEDGLLKAEIIAEAIGRPAQR